jgi:uncharacterized protein YjcR
MRTPIKNRRAYPKSLKQAVLKAVQLAPTDTSSRNIADSYNISKATVQVWKRQAKLQKAVPAGLARYQQTNAALKQYNTMVYDAKTDTIAYKGNIYS